jgi:hypothetical protein
MALALRPVRNLSFKHSVEHDKGNNSSTKTPNPQTTERATRHSDANAAGLAGASIQLVSSLITDANHRVDYPKWRVHLQNPTYTQGPQIAAMNVAKTCYTIRLLCFMSDRPPSDEFPTARESNCPRICCQRHPLGLIAFSMTWRISFQSGIFSAGDW